MKVVQINQVSGYGSTGRIAEDLSDIMSAAGIENRILYGVGHSQHPCAVRFGSKASLLGHKLIARGLGLHGAGSAHQTKRMIAFLRQYRPDIVHLHNIHGFYIHLPLLFAYLKAEGLPVVWTLHDCWSFTGHCAYFSLAHCGRWQSGCGACPQRFAYPRSLIDASAHNWQWKKELFTGLTDCVLVTPSRWLAELVGQSFLGTYPIKVIPNGIDLDTFQPCAEKSQAPKRILANAKTLRSGDWKGGCYLPELARCLGPEYRIEVLGLADAPPADTGVRALPYVNDREELARLYSQAAVFVNTTLEDNFPTVNLEALACGTPVVTFATGV